MTELFIIPSNPASLTGVVTGIAIGFVLFLMWRSIQTKQKGKNHTISEIRQEQRRASEYLTKFIAGTRKPYELRKVFFTGKEYTAFVKYKGLFSNTFYVRGRTLFDVSERLRERIFR